MRTVGLVLCSALVLVLGSWLGVSLWGQSEPEHPADARPTAPPSAPRGDETAELARLRDRFRQMTPTQKAVLLRELLTALNEDVLERHREAARRRFGRADRDGDGKLSFQEAWEAGLFRVGEGQGPGRAGVASQGLPDGREASQRRGRPRGEPSVADDPHQPMPEGRAPDFPSSELEDELLRSWKLLQELNVLSEDAGE